MTESNFWQSLEQLVEASNLVVDRPRGTAHPRYPSLVYPLDYGYLAGTSASDGDGIDAWAGSLPVRTVTGIICTVDLEQRDVEIKLLLGCTSQETREVLAAQNTGSQACILIERASP